MGDEQEVGQVASGVVSEAEVVEVQAGTSEAEESVDEVAEESSEEASEESVA